MSYKGPKFEVPRTPQCQKDANPLALCRIASADGARPLNMTSFLWIQMDHNVAKIVCHSSPRRNVPPPRDRQNASPEFTTRWPTPVASHTVWAKGQTKNKCGQSSTAPAHSGHSAGASGTMRCNLDLVIRRRRNKSQANTLIFRGRRRFHTTRHLCKMSGSSGFSWSRSRLYAARVVKLGPFHIHASCTAFDMQQSVRSSCNLFSSAARWSRNTTGRGGTQALFQDCCTKTPLSVDRA